MNYNPNMMPNSGCGCNVGPEYYNQVVNKCYVEEVPHVVNINTHCVNTCIKKHITIPNYTTTQETVCIDEYQPNMFQFPVAPEFIQTQGMQPNMPNVANSNLFNNVNPFNF